MNDFTAPRTWTVGELVTKAMLDQQVRDNETWLQAVAETASRKSMYVADDCFFLPGAALAVPYLAGGVSSSSAGAGAAASMAATSATNPGQIQLSTGTTAAGTSALVGVAADQVQLGSNEFRFAACLNIPVLSVVGDRFTIRSGIGDSATVESTDFVGFRYTDSVNAGKWQGVCRSNTGETTIDTGIAAAAAAFHVFAFTVNAAGSSVQFYIDGAAVGAPITLTIPNTSARLTQFLPAFIAKSLGLTARTVLIDYYSYLMAVSR